MKSIKEKSEEHLNSVYAGYDDVLKELVKESYVAGANYVLSVLYDAAYKEDWITNPKDGIRRFFEIYRQLKK